MAILSKTPSAAPANAPTQTQWAFVGCRTTAARQGQGKGIGVYAVDADGAWQYRHTVAAGDNPSYLAVDASGRFLHAVHGDGNQLSSFAILADGQLQALGSQSCQGRNPVHLAFSPCGRWLVVANYASGSVACLPVQADGSLAQVCALLALPTGSGPHCTEQTGPHPHQVQFDPSGQWLVVPDKGADALHTLRLDSASGQLQHVRSLRCTTGSGPRHIAFDADGQRAWLVLELSSQVLALHFDATSGAFTAQHSYASTPADFHGQNSAAGIVWHAASGQLAVSNRGHGSICIWQSAPTSAALSAPRWLRTQGTTPRFISAQASASAHVAGSPLKLLIANEDAHLIEWAQIDAVHTPSAKALSTHPLAHTGSPVCVVFTQGTP